MKRTLLALLLVIASTSGLTAQCVVKFSDTLSLFCGDSARMPAILEPTVIGGPTNNTLNQVWFYDAFHGYIAGENGTFLRTTDSGHNWTLTSFLPDQNWTSVNFTSQQTGYMASAGGKIAKTTDAGATWTVIFDNPGMYFTRIRFINATTGFAIGEQGLILKTTDGITWNTIPAVTTARLNDIVFVNQVKGFIAGDYDNVNAENALLTTSDGGNNWVNSIFEPGVYKELKCIAFADENVGFVSGVGNTWKTTNGGASWQFASWQHSVSIAVQDDSTVLLCEPEKISRLNMVTLESDIFFWVQDPKRLNSVTCPDHLSMFAAGTLGLIMSYHAPVSYQWSPSAGLSATNVLTPMVSPLQTTVYTVTAQLADGSFCSDSTRVEVGGDWHFPDDLCMVTVDSATSHNRIIWNKPGSSAADSVYLYKEGNVTGKFNRLAGYSAALPGEYLDQQSNATVRAERYALKILDKCSFVSELGYKHKPVHLSINQGIGSTINLIWEPYEGADVLTYNIYRRAGTGNPELLVSLPGSVTQYTDLNPPSGALTYVVEAMINADCNTKTTGSSSLSNLARYSSYPHGIGDGQVPDAFRINDNPVSGHFTLRENKLEEIARISLVSMNGKPVAVWNNPTGSSFDVSWLAPGLYILKIELKTSPLSFMQKLVKI